MTIKFVFLFLAALLAAVLTLTALPVHAETIDVYDDHGGSVAAYNAEWSAHGQAGASVRITGPCKSACTVLLLHIPRNRICVMPNARFGFHMAKRPDMTALLWNGYPADIKAWIKTHGGWTPEFAWMRAPDIFRYFKRC
jgi:hypothetical protein